MAVSLSISTQPSFSSTSNAYFGRTLYFNLSGLTAGRKYKLSRDAVHTMWEEIWTGAGTETQLSFSVPVDLIPTYCANSASYSFGFWAYEYDESNTRTSYDVVEFKLSVPASYVPTVSINVYDLNGHAEIYGAFLQSASRVGVSITANGVAGSTIKTYTTNIEDGVYNTASVESNALRNSGECSVSVTVKDSRGRTATVTEKITVLPYSLPKITALKTKRTDANGNSISTGEYLTVVFDADVSSLNGRNVPAYALTYNRVGEEEETEIPLTAYSGLYSVSGGTATFPASKNETWSAAVTVTDGITSVTRRTTGAAVGKLFSVLHRGLGFAFGKQATLESVFEVGFKSKFSGGILPVALDANANFDDILTANYYIGQAEIGSYINCPISCGAFSLTVKEIGTGGGIVQELATMGNYRYGRHRRMFDGAAWNAWRQIENTVSLPFGYTDVEYIQSSGKQHIDTGFVPNQDTRVIMDAHSTDGTLGTSGALFHARDSSNGNGFGVFVLSDKFRCDYKNSKITLAATVPTDKRYIFDFNKNVHTIGETITTHTASTFSSQMNLILFGSPYNGSISYNATMKLYSCKIYDNGTLVRDYVPCKTDGGVYGLFDCLNGVFYNNAGTGVFTGA